MKILHAYAIVLILGALVAIEGALYLQPMMDDDYGLVVTLREFPGLFEYCAYYYMNIGGWIFRFIQFWFSAHWPRMGGLLSGVAFMGVIVFAWRLAFLRWPRLLTHDRYLFVVFFGVFWFGLPGMEEILFWRSGSPYIWSTLILLTFLYVCKRLMGTSKFTLAHSLSAVALFVRGFLFLFLGVCVGFLGPQVFAAIGVLGLASAICLWKEKAPRRIWLLLGCGVLGVLIGFTLFFIAPGNAVRLNAQGAVLSITLAERMKGFALSFIRTYMTAQALIPMLALLTLFLYEPHSDMVASEQDGAPKKRACNRVQIGAFVWVGAGCASLAPLFLLTGSFPPRTACIAATFLIIAFASLGRTSMALPKILHARGRRMNLEFAAVLVLSHALFLDACETMHSAYVLNKQNCRREEVIAVKIASGENDILVQPLEFNGNRRTIHCTDASWNADGWINQYMARYYGVRSFRTTPAIDDSRIGGALFIPKKSY